MIAWVDIVCNCLNAVIEKWADTNSALEKVAFQLERTVTAIHDLIDAVEAHD